MHMDKSDVDVAAILALKALEKEERLRRIMNQSASAYYCRDGVAGSIGGALIMGGVIWMIVVHLMPEWSLVLFGFTMLALLEGRRQRTQLNALIELREVDKAKEAAQTTAREGTEPEPSKCA
jgi:hypothetical protein